MKNEIDKYNLSYSQQSLYFLQELNPSNTSYNVGIAFRFYQNFNEELFRATFNQLLLRHDILKTKFLKENGEIYQYIDKQAKYDLVIRDISELNDTKISEQVNSDFHVSYNLLTDNLLRIYLYRHKNYVLVSIVLHHIIADFNSVEILMNDFITIYDSLMKKQKVSISSMPALYKNFVEEERDFICSEKFPSKMKFWENKLKDRNEDLDFDIEAEQESTFLVTKGSKVEFEIKSEENAKIKSLCEKIHVSPFIFFLTVYKLFLFQVYGKRDVVVGVPVSLRRAIKYKAAIGNFINLLPIRMSNKGGNFIQNAKEVNDTFINAMLHKKVPYSLMVEHLNPNRDKKDPIFQTTFNYLSKRTDSNLYMDQSLDVLQTILGYSIKSFPLKQQLDQMDLSLELVEHHEGFTGIFKYNNAVFNQNLIRDYAFRYKKLLSRIVNHIESDIDHFRYANENERKELISISTKRIKNFKSYFNVMELIEENFSAYPERIAIRDMQKAITYQQLQVKVDILAACLEQKGIQKNDCVVVYMEKSAEVIAAFLAIIKIGAIYVPVDTSFPKSRIDDILESTTPAAILTTKSLKEKEVFLNNAICVDSSLKSDPLLNRDNKIVRVKPKDSAYIIFTSGSTGKPKGVEVQHQALVNFLLSMREILTLQKKDKVNIGGITNISFDISILEFLLPLVSGGQATLLTKEVLASPRMFEKIIADFEINIFQGTATTWSMILGSAWPGDKNLDVLIGGEMVSKALSNELTSKFSKVWNVYGPTEATIWTTIKQLSPKDEIVSAGYPIHNMGAYILDETYQIVQKNVIGKLYLSGVGLAKGYYKQENLTNERFFEIELDGIKKRIYDTGDLAKYLDNGEIQIIGRDDSQVKLSGYRIELGEIENKLNKFNGIKRSAVLIKEQKLVAYIVYEGRRDNLLGELKDYCRQELPVYMIPSEFIKVDTIPLTPNQKTDKKQLISLKGDRLSESSKTVRDGSYAYKDMIHVWGETLGHQNFGIKDNFFDIGGTSLLAMVLQQKIEKELRVQVSVADIFTYPTVYNLAEFLESQRSHKQKKQIKQIENSRKTSKLGNLRKRRNRKV
ncbi:non-ribosomal peptide synthetase [Streptococcus macacae]|uniref:AMP-binding enzyme n=1 Tax=Streptococcus macacae NCTC 11558 TaxID=764298 RepID=G5JUF9_9STRE|nr:non-ribosomal peptide synthetase [Streptococcus macacae]EHJ52619.1 AMP-binding enzyme [Streptococcus macacae NCTC 11558]SUN78601.1 putative non-ribosomal peptide sythetase [Streptococcus macacae NCTC 11558]